MSLKSKKKDKNKDRMKKKRDKKDDSIKKKEKKEVKEKDDSKDKSDMDELFQNSVMKEYYDLVETHYPSLSKMMPTKIIPHHSKTPSDLDLSKAQKELGQEKFNKFFKDVIKDNVIKDLHSIVENQMNIWNKEGKLKEIEKIKDIYNKGRQLSDHSILLKNGYVLKSDIVYDLSDEKLIELYYDYKNLYGQNNNSEEARLLKRIDSEIKKRQKKDIFKKKFSDESGEDIDIIIKDLDAEYKKNNKGLRVKDDNGNIVRQGDNNFIKYFTKAVLNQKDKKLELKCGKPGEKAKPFVYQLIPALAVAPGGSCDRLLCVHRTGAGKTVTILSIMANYFYDPRPKILFFPNQVIADNFIGSVINPVFSNNNPYQEYIRCMASFEEIFILSEKLPKWWKSLDGSKELNDKQKVYFDFNPKGCRDFLQMKSSNVKYITDNPSASFLDKFKAFQKAKSQLKSDSSYRKQALAQLELIKKLDPKDIEKAYESQKSYFLNKKMKRPTAPMKFFGFEKGGSSKFRIHNKNTFKVLPYNKENLKKLDAITSYPKDGNKRFIDNESNLKSSTLGLNPFNDKIIALDEFHMCMDPASYGFDKKETQKNIGFFMKLLQDMTRSVMVAFTATPGETKEDINTMVSIVKGNDNKSKSNAGFISYWNYSPTSLYPRLFEPHTSDALLSAEYQIEMIIQKPTSLNISYIEDIKEIKKGNKRIHPFDLSNEDKTKFRKDEKRNDFFTPASYYYYYHNENKELIEDYMNIHKKSPAEQEKIMDKMLSKSKGNKMKNLMMMCNVPLKSIHPASMKSFLEYVKKLKVEDLGYISDKIYTIAEKLIDTKFKTLIIMNKDAGLEFFAHLLAEFVKKIEKKGGGSRPGLARCEDNKGCKKSSCFITMIDKDDGEPGGALEAFNQPCNIRGDVIKAAIIDAVTFGTGVSFLGVRNIYLVNPPAKLADYQQYVGRAMRACASHVSLQDEKKKGLEQHEMEVYVSVFCSVMAEGGPGREEYIGEAKNSKYKQIKTIDEINIEKVLREEEKQNALYTKELRNNSIDFAIYDTMI